MIVHFADKATADIYDGNDSKAARKIPKSIWQVACSRLDLLNRAAELRDMMDPPGNRLEKLKGDLREHYSLRINAQYRIIFRFQDGRASDVQIVDYHR